MANETSICNQALAKVGGELITSLEGNTNEVNLCKLHYADIRDAVLNAHQWSFAIEWHQLAAQADPPLGEYPNAFPLPADALQVLFVGLDYSEPTVNWQVEGNAIRTDEGYCKTQLLMRVTDVSRYSPLFIQALVARLSAELAIPIAESRELQADLFALYEQKIQEAVAKDNQQGRARRLRSRWLSQVRFRDGVRWAGPYV